MSDPQVIDSTSDDSKNCRDFSAEKGDSEAIVSGFSGTTRWWLSWYQAGPDHRPLTYPPNDAILGWWCTGQREDDVDTLCALVQAESEATAWKAVLKDWPDMIDRRFTSERPPGYVITSDRFPLSDWMIPRMSPAEVPHA